VPASDDDISDGELSTQEGLLELPGSGGITECKSDDRAHGSATNETGKVREGAAGDSEGGDMAMNSIVMEDDLPGHPSGIDKFEKSVSGIGLSSQHEEREPLEQGHETGEELEPQRNLGCVEGRKDLDEVSVVDLSAPDLEGHDKFLPETGAMDSEEDEAILNLDNHEENQVNRPIRPSPDLATRERRDSFSIRVAIPLPPRLVAHLLTITRGTPLLNHERPRTQAGRTRQLHLPHYHRRLLLY